MNSQITPAPEPPGGTAAKYAHQIAQWMLSLPSTNTRAAYLPDLTRFTSWLDLDWLELLEVATVHVNAYRLSLTLTLAGVPASNARALAAISSFYRFVVSNTWLSTNPVVVVRRPKIDADTSSTQGVTQIQVKALPHEAAKDRLRANALVMLLLFTGIRISEARGSQGSDLGHDAGHRVLTITRKGGKRAKVVVTACPSGRRAHRLHRSHRRRTRSGRARRRPHSSPPAQASPGTALIAYCTVRRLAQQAGNPGTITPHALRHTFVTLALQGGATLHDLQDTLGHTDPRTTRRYDRTRHRLERSAAHKDSALLELA